MFIARMTMSALRIVNGTIMPTMIPVRQPRNSDDTEDDDDRLHHDVVHFAHLVLDDIGLESDV